MTRHNRQGVERTADCRGPGHNAWGPWRVAAVVAALGLAGVTLGAEALAPSRVVPPSTYELVINGESFTVESNRLEKLKSEKNPGVTYDVALRLAPQQRLRLRTLEMTYDRGFVAERDDEGLPTVTLFHELGFSIIVTDLGKALSADERAKYLNGLVEAFKKQAQPKAVGEVEVTKPAATDANHARGEVVVLHYRDADDISHACAVYVLDVGQTGASVVVTMLDRDAENGQPMVESLLDSLQERPAPPRRPR